MQPKSNAQVAIVIHTIPGQKRLALVEPLAELNRIRVRDNGEPLVNAERALKGVVFDRDTQYIENAPHRFYGRQTVIEMLQRAKRALPRGRKLLLISIYRSVEQQVRMYQRRLDQLAADHPQWPYNVLRREANRWVHPPDVKTPPGHSTGGAVDLLIAGRNGEALSFSSPYALDEEGAPVTAHTFSPHIDAAARKNRALLIAVMSGAGFTNYGGEFWHWSYGDSCWAWRQRRRVAFYGAAIPPR